MAGEYQFSLIDVTKQQGTKTILKDVNLSFFYGAHIGVIGGNGAGKSSLLKILAGLDTDLIGTVQVAKGTKVGYLPQEPELDDSKTVGECVEEAIADAKAKIERYEDLCCNLDDPKAAAEMERLQEEIDAKDLWNVENQMERAMASMHCPDKDAKVAVLSGGERRRVAICRLLLSDPDVLLLDEPTNHLDAETVQWLEEYLKDFKGTLIVVTHDRYFLSDVTEWILELDHGICYPYKGNYEEWLKQKQEQMARDAKAEKSRQKLLANELEWIHTNPSGRHSKSQARVKRYEELAAQQREAREDDLVIRIPNGPRLGNLVVRAEHVAMGFDGKMLYTDLNFDLPRGGIVGVIGANGAGKTTLFKLMTGELKPLSGELRIGETVQLSYVDQLRTKLDPEHTVYEEITGGGEFVNLAGSGMLNGRAYCTRFNFRGADQQKKVGVLSGGERNRVHLAKLLRGGGNLLLLDEPTNDLDIQTLQVLEEYLQDFPGCVIVVSHDRYFTDKVVDHLLVFKGDGVIKDFPGNYSQYREWLSLQPQEKGEGAKSAKESKANKEQNPKREQSETRRKMTYKEKREFEQLEIDIAALEAEQKAIEEALCSGTLSIDELTEKSKRLPQLKDELDEKTMRWLELSEI